MAVYVFEPLRDPRWAPFVARHPKASVFHSTAWLLSLQRTYSYIPLAFTTSGPGVALANAVVVADVRSWLTGRRLVSLPFSDHCEPLVDSADDLATLCAEIRRHRAEGRWKYVEIRPASPLTLGEGFGPTQTFYLHRVDLQPDLDTLLRS